MIITVTGSAPALQGEKGSWRAGSHVTLTHEPHPSLLGDDLRSVDLGLMPAPRQKGNMVRFM